MKSLWGVNIGLFLLSAAGVAWKRSLPLPLPRLLRPWLIAALAGSAILYWLGSLPRPSLGALAFAGAALALSVVAHALPTSRAQMPANELELRGRWVLVTGASAGLGREMARQLAREQGANLVLLARRKDRLSELQAELEQGAGVRVVPLAADLSQAADVERVLSEILAGPPLHGVILNAGVTYLGPHEALAPAAFRTMLDTNVTSVVRFASVLVPDMLQRAPGGGVLFVSSVAGLQPAPYQSAYSGTKAFMVHFAFGLWHELRGRNISITTFAPGGIKTEMTETPSFAPLRSWLMPADEAARQGLAAFRRRDHLYVPGFVNRLGAGLTRVLPRRFLTALIARAYRQALGITVP
jgi:short-subunit dehydrogenase